MTALGEKSMTELEELKLAYAECSRQRNELLNKLKSQVQPAPVQLDLSSINLGWCEGCTPDNCHGCEGRYAEQEPVVRWDSDGWGDLLVSSLPDGTLLYTSPPARQEPVPDRDMWNVCSRLNSALKAIGDFAHDKSTGPAEPDALWEIRTMAYDAIEAAHDIKDDM